MWLVALITLLSICHFSYSLEYAEPLGFEEEYIDAPSQLQVSLVYNDKIIKNVDIEQRSEFISFLDPHNVVSGIDNIKESSFNYLVNLLTARKFLYNQHLLCKDKQQKNCGYIAEPDDIELIYDTDKYNLYIFINKKHLFYKDIDPIGSKYLEVPDNKLGFGLNTNTNLYTSYAEQIEYTAQLDTTVSYNNSRLVSNFSYEPSGLAVNDLHWTQYHKDYLYRGLIYQLQDLRISSSKRLLGVSAASFLDRQVDLRDSYTTPIKMLFAYPSYVRIYKDEQLLSSKRYGSGWHYLDTSNLPDGYYKIKLEITDIRGAVSQTEKLFIKSIRLPPINKKLWYADIGLVNPQFIGNNLEYSRDLLMRYGLAFRYSEQIGLAGHVLHDSQRLFAEAHFDYQGKKLFVVSSMLASNKADFIYNLNANITFDLANLGFNARFVHYAQDPVSISGLVPFTQLDKITLANQISSNFFDINANLKLAYTVDNEDMTDFSYLVGLRKLIFKNKHLNSVLNLTTNYSSTESTHETVLSISVNANIKNWVLSNSNYYTLENDLLNSTALFRWSEEYGRHNVINSTNFNLKNDFYNNTSQSTYQNNLAYKNDYATINHGLNSTNQQTTSANIKFGILGSSYSSKSVLQPNVAISQKLLTEGLIVRVNTPVKESIFRIILNDRPIDRQILPNTNVVIPLEPYKSYSVKLEVISEHMLSYSDELHHIIIHPGNIVNLVWEAIPSSISMLYVSDIYGEPLQNAKLEQNNNFAFTDDAGMLEARLVWGQDMILTTADGNECVVKWPNELTQYEEFIFLDTPQVCPSNNQVQNKAVIQDDVVVEDYVNQTVVPLTTSVPLESSHPKLSRFVLPQNIFMEFDYKSAEANQSIYTSINKIVNANKDNTEILLLELVMEIYDNTKDTISLARTRLQVILDLFTQQGFKHIVLVGTIDIKNRDIISFCIDNNIDVSLNQFGLLEYLLNDDSHLIKVIPQRLLFDTNSYKLNIGHTNNLIKIANYLDQLEGYKKIYIQGHSSLPGTADYNYLISRERATNVKNILHKMMSSKYDVYSVPKSNTKPLHTSSMQQNLNRRVEIHLTQ